MLGAVTQPVLQLVQPLVDSTGVLPPELLPSTVETITEALTSTAAPLVPADVASLLTVLSPEQVAQLATDPAAVSPLLGGLVETLTGLAGQSAPATDAVNAALAQLTAILSGLGAGADGLEGLTNVLVPVTTLLGKPSVAQLPVVGPLVAQLGTLAGALPAGPTKTALTEAAAAATRGLDAATLAALAAGNQNPAVAAVPAAKPASAKVLRARIVAVVLSQNRRSVRIRISCPAAAPAAGCRVSPSVRVAGRTARVARTATVRRGAVRTLKAAVPASVARRAGRRGGRVVVKVATSGSRAGAVSKTVRIRRAR